jgi:hypothetical protein
LRELLASLDVDENWANQVRAIREESRMQERDWPE